MEIRFGVPTVTFDQVVNGSLFTLKESDELYVKMVPRCGMNAVSIRTGERQMFLKTEKVKPVKRITVDFK